jgi:AcrR family transcriptional regulator
MKSSLPPSIAAAWGRREPPRKGPKPGLTLERIVDAGVRVARAEGLAAVSMARVAQELGASTMSLYRYLAAKDELLALMIDAALGPPPPACSPDEDWRAGLSRWAWGYHDRLREHPWALRVPISGPPVTPNQVAWLEDGLSALRRTALTEEEKASVVLLLSGYVRNEATLTADIPPEAASDAGMYGYARLLESLTEPGRFPAIHALLASGAFDKADPPEKEFTFGLERILDGVESLIRGREP